MTQKIPKRKKPRSGRKEKHRVIASGWIGKPSSHLEGKEPSAENLAHAEGKDPVERRAKGLTPGTQRRQPCFTAKKGKVSATSLEASSKGERRGGGGAI